jgi:hypothetical protein
MYKRNMLIGLRFWIRVKQRNVFIFQQVNCSMQRRNRLQKVVSKIQIKLINITVKIFLIVSDLIFISILFSIAQSNS